MFFKIGVLTNFAIFTGKHLCWSLFLIKLETFNCFPENKVKFFVSTYFYETPPVATSADVFFYIMFWKRRCWIYCIYIFHNSFILKPNITLIRVHSISFIVPLVGIGRTTCCFRFHLLLLVAIHYHLLSHFATSCYSLYHSLSFVVTCCTTGCHSWSLDLLFVCLFINHPLFESILFSRMSDQVCLKMCWEVCEDCQSGKSKIFILFFNLYFIKNTPFSIIKFFCKAF